ncbi:hypothetical protein [Novipirellula sp.]|uniref:hypothetical protein n=1 Tax=Novipirellula sp. TaxID=2795430 RepID=UPI0035692012
MNDEFIHVDVGEEFSYEGSRYRKLDDRRAFLLSDNPSEPKADEKVIHFYPEDEVSRDISESVQLRPTEELTARPRLRNALVWSVIFAVSLILAVVILSTITWAMSG